MKDMVSGNKNKIYVLKNVDFDQQLFELNKVRKGNFTNQCTGFEYVDKLNSTMLSVRLSTMKYLLPS